MLSQIQNKLLIINFWRDSFTLRDAVIPKAFIKSGTAFRLCEKNAQITQNYHFKCTRFGIISGL